MAVTVHTAATWMYPNGRCCRCVRLDTIPMATVVSEPLRVSVPCEFSVFLQTLALSLSVCLSVCQNYDRTADARSHCCPDNDPVAPVAVDICVSVHQPTTLQLTWEKGSGEQRGGVLS